MSDVLATLQNTARDFADVIPVVDRYAEHNRWKPGIGPFEEEIQVEMILDELATDCSVPEYLESEVPYPDSGRRCDLLLENGNLEIPTEVKLLRFRLDNGNIDPNMYKSVFSPFPESGSSSLLTDSRKLIESEFDAPFGLLGLYYEKEDEEYDELRADSVAEKFQLDVEYWYDFHIETVAIE